MPADFISFVISFGGFILAVVAGTLWLVARPRSTAPRRFLLCVGIGYTVASIYGVPYLAGRIVAAGYRPLRPGDLDDRPSAIVVLGSGSFTAKDWNDSKFSIVDPAAATRVLEAARVYRFVHARWVISSGGLAHRSDERTASGNTMRDALVELGVPPDRIIVEAESRNTHDEAEIIASILAPLHLDHVILVTTAEHMRRSVGAFRAVGVTVVPAIARDPLAADPLADWLVPSNLGLQHSNNVAHEVVGIAYYAIRGWYR